MNLISTVVKSLMLCALAASTSFAAQQVRVDITNNAPTGGVALTPLWVGFHDGSFDSYNGGLSSQEGLERIAEDGNTSVLSADFLGGYTYVDGGVSTRTLSSQAGAERVDGTIGSAGPPPIEPGESASQTFTIEINGTNRYFSYASMVIPTNDFYVANGNPLAHDLASLYDGSGSVSFNIGLANTVNDAGTETTSYLTSAANGLFGLGGGQSGPNEGADENGVNTNVTGDPFAGFGIETPAAFNFNDASLYANGIATVTITAVPEPSSQLVCLMGLAGLAFFRRK